MTIKLTINKIRSEEAGRVETRKSELEIDKLEGKEKLMFDIKVLESRIFNVKEDIKKFGANLIFLQKLKLMEDQVARLRKELK
jgi:hypothetical protein